MIATEGLNLSEILKANHRIISDVPENSDFPEERFAMAELYLKRDQKNIILALLNIFWKSPGKSDSQFKFVITRRTRHCHLCLFFTI